ncbi:hypothetical protein VSDG_03464 [Cytospora chrysosperma]|uniref:Chromo domain-containing protein n=1 Tax=Cytospora chrysosperma TaxID=252740 RepID=A0A423W9S3_CYTCH|nr:hypothetical protein VSDG_03464 [Valsa sordida]
MEHLTPASPDRVAATQPAPGAMAKDGTQKYIAEEIMGHAVMKKPGQHRATQHYEVKWMGYEGTTWEPHDALMEDIPKMKLVNGARRLAAQGDDREPDPGFYADPNIQTTPINPQSPSEWATDQLYDVSVKDFVTEEAARALVEQRDAWFLAQEEAKARRPDEDEKPRANLAGFNTDKVKSIYQSSPAYGCIMLLNDVQALPYHDNTVTAIGNDKSPRFSTLVSWSAKRLDMPHMCISFDIGYNSNRVTLSKVTIPLDRFTNVPKLEKYAADAVQQLMARHHMAHDQQNGAWVLHFVTTTDGIRVMHSDHVARDLRNAGMPGVDKIRRDIDRIFAQDRTSITMLIPEEWKDVEDQAESLALYFDIARTNIYQDLSDSRRVITRLDVKLALPADTQRVSAKMAFDDVAQCITILSDGVSREHKYQEWLSKELGSMDMKAIMIPMGRQKCHITRPDGKVVEKPLIYSVHIMTAQNPQLLAQVMPALNSSVKLDIEVPYTAVDVPTEDKTPEHIVLMITASLHQALWSYRLPRTDRSIRAKLLVDEFAKIITPYITFDSDPDMTPELQQRLREALALDMARALQKVRANKDTGETAETPQQHRDRVREKVCFYYKWLTMPPSTSGTTPRFFAIRYAFADAMGTLSDFQFLAKRPRYMNWPRSETRKNPSPFLDFHAPKLPKNKNPTDALVAALLRNPNAFTVPLKIVEPFDDLTTRCKEAGLRAMDAASDTRLVKWFTTFEGEPLTWDAVDTFSVLQRAEWHMFYSDITDLSDSDDTNGIQLKYDVDLDHLAFPEPLRGKDGRVIEATTRRHQQRENRTVQAVVTQFRRFNEDQMQAFRLLRRLPFGTLIIEGVPGSGKTMVALWFLTAIIGSSYQVDKLNRSFELPVHVPDEAPQQALELDSDSDDDLEHIIHPDLRHPAEEHSEEEEEDEDKAEVFYDLPPLMFGPTDEEFEQCVSRAEETHKESEADQVTALITEIWRVFEGKLVTYIQGLPSTYNKRAVFTRWRKYWATWTRTVRHMIDIDDVTICEPTEPEPETEAPEDTAEPKEPQGVAKIGDLAEHLSVPTADIPATYCYPKAMIIANQNINGDDLAARLDHIHQDIQCPIAIIKVNNLDNERDQLIRRYTPRHGDEIEQDISMADMLDVGIDDSSLAEFATGKGKFAPCRHGGVYRLEAIMRAKLNSGENAALERDLRRMADPDQPSSHELYKSVRKSIDQMIKDILNDADVVVCTFAVAYGLCNRKLFQPIVVYIDEASREHEANIRWAQIALDPQMIICAGDYRQDKPFCLTANSGQQEEDIKTHFNPFAAQFMTPLSQRMMASVPNRVAFFKVNHRQMGGLQELPSALFYHDTITTPHDIMNMDDITSMWEEYTIKLVTDNRKSRKPKDVRVDRSAREKPSGNRVTWVCTSSQKLVGTSPINHAQAIIAVEQAAKIHQAGIPGMDLPATGGEWDVTINVLVRDTTMGFLADPWRMNVMLTRPIYWSMDIIDIKLFEDAKGRGNHIMRKYRDYQRHMGAIVTDERNWAEDSCRCCFERHPAPCKAQLRCFLEAKFRQKEDPTPQAAQDEPPQADADEANAAT